MYPGSFDLEIEKKRIENSDQARRNDVKQWWPLVRNPSEADQIIVAIHGRNAISRIGM